MTEPTTHELATPIAVLEEKMNTHKQEYKTDIAMLAEKIAQRDNRLLLTIIVIVGVAAAVLGVLIAGIPAA